MASRVFGVSSEIFAGLMLAGAAALGMIAKNTAATESLYDAFLSLKTTVAIGEAKISKPLLLWINDGLMAIFFLLVGLEIKREVKRGALSTWRRAALPVYGAVGGVVVPVLVFLGIVGIESAESSGWAIPAATDIAFALGVLALLGRRVPLSLLVFLSALAIADDIGAVLVIAIFYTAELSLGWLVFGLGVFLLAILANKLGARNPITYGIIGLVVWLAFLKSGVHATIAGVIMAMAIPAKQRIDLSRFVAFAEYLLEKLRGAKNIDGSAFSTNEQMASMQTLENSVEQVMTPLQRYEHGLQPWVAWFIMPVFALGNAGVEIGASVFDDLTSPIGLGVIAGLVLGKQLGVTLFSWLSVKLGIADLPTGVTWRHIYGTSWLAGIGFTMSLFVANLAFGASAAGEESKIGILFASTIAGVVGYVILRTTKPVE